MIPTWDSCTTLEEPVQYIGSAKLSSQLFYPISPTYQLKSGCCVHIWTAYGRMTKDALGMLNSCAICKVCLSIARVLTGYCTSPKALTTSTLTLISTRHNPYLRNTASIPSRSSWYSYGYVKKCFRSLRCKPSFVICLHICNPSIAIPIAIAIAMSELPHLQPARLPQFAM